MRKRSFFMGFVCALLVVCLLGSAMASTGSKAAELIYKNIKIMLNGEEIEPRDANGDIVEPFIINGTTYLPVRAVSEALGLDVEWDESSNTVILKDPRMKEVKIPTFTGEEYKLKPGEVFTKGCYVMVDKVKILYNGEKFEVSNQGDDAVSVTVWIVGVKKNGTQKLLQTANFRGVDVYQYNEDIEEDGWAIEEYTNIVRSGDTLLASISVSDFSSLVDGLNADVDEDGYYDITFVVSPKKSEDKIQISHLDLDTAFDVYKFAVEGNTLVFPKDT